MIDIHTHIGKFDFGQQVKPFHLLNFMDKNGIEKAVILPLENPEETYYYVTTNEVLKICRKHSDRLIPFCNIDPRRGLNKKEKGGAIEKIIKSYVDEGCKGFGEVLANLRPNDPRMKTIYKICGKLKIPVLLHIQGLAKGTYGLYDKLGLPYFEESLREFPETTFIAHGHGFWIEISAEFKDRNRLQKDKVKKQGRVDCLLKKYPNLYGDLSAGSGYNALARDREFAYPFMERHRDKLLFGTDYLMVGQKCLQIEFLKEAKEKNLIKKETYEKIAFLNAKRLLGINFHRHV